MTMETLLAIQTAPADMMLAAPILIVLVAFAAEYVDSTLGMGYGTTLTPLLLLFGFTPIQVVPAILLSELLSGLFAGAAHHVAGNVNFRPKDANGKGVIANLKALGYVETFRRTVPMDLKIASLIAACSTVGTITAVFLAVKLNAFYLKLYIGTMVLLVGLFILYSRKKNWPFSWRRMIGWSLVASFNKGVSGGGYGPIVTGGQVLSGVRGKNAVAITSLAEGLTCVVGFATYLCFRGINDWGLFPYLCAGALMSVPLSAWTVKKVPTGKLTLAIGILTVCLGALTLWKVLF